MIENSAPTVSVLMTAFNREKYIAESVESVLASTFKDFELIIVDDCSTDNTLAIALEYKNEDRRVKVYKNEENLGDYSNRNKAASYAVGKYLKYVDSDDLLYPYSLEAFVWGMEKEPSAALGICETMVTDNKPFPLLVNPRDSYKLFFENGKFFYEGPSSVIIKRSVFNEIGGFSGKPYVGDTELWLKVGAIYPIVQLPPHLFWWRIHEQQQIKEGNSTNFYRDTLPIIFYDILKDTHCPLTIEERNRILKNIKNGRIKKSFKLLLRLKFQEGFDNLRVIKHLD